MTGHYEIYTDGACIGNPGPMGIGVIVKKDGSIINKLSKHVGNGTNNQAEYLAVIEALTLVSEYQPNSISLFADSKLVINQINQDWRCNNETLKTLLSRVKFLTNKLSLESINFKWIDRDKNEIADKLASNASKNSKSDRNSNNIYKNLRNSPPLIKAGEKAAKLPPVNSHCSKVINLINSKSLKASPEDFAKLDSFKNDKYQALLNHECCRHIKERFGIQELNWMKSSLLNFPREIRANSFKWASRGLYPTLAIKKAALRLEKGKLEECIVNSRNLSIGSRVVVINKVPGIVGVSNGLLGEVGEIVGQLREDGNKVFLVDLEDLNKIIKCQDKHINPIGSMPRIKAGYLLKFKCGEYGVVNYNVFDKLGVTSPKYHHCRIDTLIRKNLITQIYSRSHKLHISKPNTKFRKLLWESIDESCNQWFKKPLKA